MPACSCGTRNPRSGQRALEDGFPGVVEAQPELLAFHCMEAGLVREAIDYWERAGRRAAQRYATRGGGCALPQGAELGDAEQPARTSGPN